MAKVFRFALVARGTTSLAKYPVDDPDLYGKAIAMLRKLDPNAPFSVVEQQHLLFTASTTQDGVSFICLCETNVETRRVGQFLSNLKSKWFQSYGPAASEMAEDSKDDEFQTQLKDLIDHYNQICPPIPATDEPAPAPLPEVGEIELRDPDEGVIHITGADPGVAETFHDDGSLTRLRLRILWQRYRCKVLFVIVLIVWLYILVAWYCGDATLAQCF
jgi:hypothetical protein